MGFPAEDARAFPRHGGEFRGKIRARFSRRERAALNRVVLAPGMDAGDAQGRLEDADRDGSFRARLFAPAQPAARATRRARRALNSPSAVMEALLRSARDGLSSANQAR